MRVDRVTVDILHKMKDSGCISISYGIESADDRILQSMEKHTTILQVERAIKMSRDAGICPFGNLLFGDKDDDLESFQRNLEWYQSHSDIQLGFNRVLVLPGSGLYNYAVRQGVIRDELEYLENGEYAINLTKLDDNQYRNCIKRMSDAVSGREYPLEDLRILRYVSEINKFYAEGICPLCRTRIRSYTDDFVALEKGTCINCGRPYTFNLYRYFGDALEGFVERKWRGRSVMIWGMGEPGQKFTAQCALIKRANVYLVDRSKARQCAYGGVEAVSPDTVFTKGNIDVILIGTDAPAAVAAIKNEIRQKMPETVEVASINGYMMRMARDIFG